MAHLSDSLHGGFLFGVLHHALDTCTAIHLIFHPGYDTGVISAVLVSLGSDLVHKLDSG
jgi:hypothetical protein